MNEVSPNEEDKPMEQDSIGVGKRVKSGYSTALIKGQWTDEEIGNITKPLLGFLLLFCLF